MNSVSRPEGSPADVLVVGEALVDIVCRADGSSDESPGGSPANVALTLGRLGRTPVLRTMLGDDSHGRAVRAWLDESNVVVESIEGARTSTATAQLDGSGAASYEFALEWDIPTGHSESVAVLHTGSIGAFLEPGAEKVSQLVDELRGRALISFDPNIRPSLIEGVDRTRDRVLSLIARADVVKASDEDIEWLHPGEAPEAVARRWAEAGPLLVVVTRGAEGVVAVRGGAADELRIASVPVEVIDTVGAGDTFMGALLDGLVSADVAGEQARARLKDLSSEGLQAILARSAQAAAITVSRAGANPPTRAELDAG